MTVTPAVLAAVIVGLVILLAYAQTANAQEFDSGDLTVSTNQFSDKVRYFARAIASAEGYGIPNAIPTLANNPGDLVIPGWTGATLGAEGISVFDADDLNNPLPPNGGWYRLFHQLQFIVDGTSRVYNLDMSIEQMAERWTDTQTDAWASNVATYLGTTPGATLRSQLT